MKLIKAWQQWSSGSDHAKGHGRKRNIMKKNLIIGAMVLGLLTLAGSAKADYTINNMDPVHLYLFDMNKDKEVTLTGSFKSWPPGHHGSTLEYSTDNSNWQEWDISSSHSSLTIKTNSSPAIIYFMVNNDQDADVTFRGPGDPYPYYKTAYILWSTKPKFNFSITATNKDRMSYAPLPTSALLLGSGLLGLTLVYRRRRGIRNV